MRDTLSLKEKMQRSVALNKDYVTPVDLHHFGDANIVASCVVFCAVVHQLSVTNQELVVGKSRISKKNFAIPGLELVSPRMASNLIENKKAALKRCNTRSVTGWTDSQDRNRFGGDLMLYINEDIPCRPLNEYPKFPDLELIVF